MRNIEDCEGISIGGTNINNLRYAVDTALLANSSQQLQAILSTVKRDQCRKDVLCRRIHHLGSMMTEDVRCEAEIKRPIGISKNTRKFLTNKKLLVKNKEKPHKNTHLVKSVIWCLELYFVISNGRG